MVIVAYVFLRGTTLSARPILIQYYCGMHSASLPSASFIIYLFYAIWQKTLIQCHSKLSVCYCVPKIQKNCATYCISHVLLLHWKRLSCWFGRDSNPGPRPLDLQGQWTTFNPYEIPLRMATSSEEELGTITLSNSRVLRDKTKRFLWRVTLPHHSNTRDVSLPAPGKHWGVAHMSHHP